jgi:hypothetical protein
LTVVVAWVGTIMAVYFGIMRRANLLRATAAEETVGLDAKYGGSAYSGNGSPGSPWRRPAINLVVPEGGLGLGPLRSPNSQGAMGVGFSKDTLASNPVPSSDGLAAGALVDNGVQVELSPQSKPDIRLEATSSMPASAAVVFSLNDRAAATRVTGSV